MSYRPTTDVWILARTKLKADDDGGKQSYYGAYPAGFLHRARQLLGVRRSDPVLHVCGGMVKECLYRGFEENDRTLDLDPKTNPDYLMDARRLGVGKGDLFPIRPPHDGGVVIAGDIMEIGGAVLGGVPQEDSLWPAMMIDRPYTLADHAEYDVSIDVFPADLNDLLKRALTCVEPGGRVGVLDYLWPSPPTKLGKEVAVIAVGTGRNNRARWFTVFERLVEPEDKPNGQGEGGQEPTEQIHEPTPPAPSGPTTASATASTVGPECFGGEDYPSDPAEEARLIEEQRRSKAALLKAAKANVCHGCSEGFLFDAEGMERIEPLTDLPHPWHRACWEQKQRRIDEAHLAKLRAAKKPARRRRRSSPSSDASMEGGF